jgi:mono/diheme cytochrome c family protein
MSCGNGANCNEVKRRRSVLVVLGLMTVIFLALSAFSFLKSRNQVTPDTVHFQNFEAVQGRRVFQSYNCMGCHTIVGNGAYFGPDLTKLYGQVGPAWLAAFLPSAGSWPSAAALRAQLQAPGQIAETGITSLDDYFKKYPGAAERVERRGGQTSFMPNLPFSSDEVGQIIAFLKYTTLMNTEGWPPKPKVDGLKFPQAAPSLNASASGIATKLTAKVVTPAQADTLPKEDQSAVGARLAKDNGCIACHATDKKRLVGPAWGGLYGTKATLADGTTVLVDEAYLIESIVQPDAKIVQGFPAHVMPAYDKLLDHDQVNAIVAYIRSLQGETK